MLDEIQTNAYPEKISSLCILALGENDSKWFCETSEYDKSWQIREYIDQADRR